MDNQLVIFLLQLTVMRESTLMKRVRNVNFVEMEHTKMSQDPKAASHVEPQASSPCRQAAQAARIVNVGGNYTVYYKIYMKLFTCVSPIHSLTY